MKTMTVVTYNAIIWIGLGIAFALYGPIMLAFFEIPETAGANELTYWQTAAFARLFGAALFGYGLLLWAVRSAIPELKPQSQRGIVFALLLANLVGLAIALTQQFAVWEVSAGWFLAALFVLHTLAYGYLLVAKPD